MATTYATHTDVSDFLLRDAPFGAGTKPTIAQVEKIINAIEDEIDRYTNTAFRAVNVVDEYQDYHSPRLYARPAPYSWYLFDVKDYRFVEFQHRPLTQISTPTDKLELWRGNTYEDIAATGTEGRDQDWWIDYDRGVLYFITKWPLRVRNGVRLTYRYGVSPVPNDVRHATVLLTSAQLASGAIGVFLLPEGGSEPGYETRWTAWEEKAYLILDRYWEMRWSMP